MATVKFEACMYEAYIHVHIYNSLFFPKKYLIKLSKEIEVVRARVSLEYGIWDQRDCLELVYS